MVSRKSEKMLCPQAQRHLCKGIVRANDVKYDEKRDEDIGGIGKLKAAICERKRQDKKHEQYVLQQPCLSIERMNRGEHPENSAKREQARNEFVLSAQNFPMRDQSQTLIEVKPCHARKLKISAESRQRGLSRLCLAFYCRRQRWLSFFSLGLCASLSSDLATASNSGKESATVTTGAPIRQRPEILYGLSHLSQSCPLSST